MFKNKAFLGIVIAVALSVAAPALAQTASYYTGPSYIGAAQNIQYGPSYNSFPQNNYWQPQPFWYQPQPIPDYHLVPCRPPYHRIGDLCLPLDYAPQPQPITTWITTCMFINAAGQMVDGECPQPINPQPYPAPQPQSGRACANDYHPDIHQQCVPNDGSWGYDYGDW